MNTQEIIRRADWLYDMASDTCQDVDFGKWFTTKELWYLWGLCCTPDSRAWDDEVYDALADQDEFKH